MATRAYEALKKMKTEIFIHKESTNIISNYNKWAEEYEKDIDAIGYKIHDESAEVLMRHLKENNRDTNVLDLLSGTGLVGHYLRKRGYSGILHGIDGSTEMLKKAKDKDVYQELQKQQLEPGNIGILKDREGYYDAVTCVGGFLRGHLDPKMLPEMAKLLKDGGHLVYTARVSVDNEDYRLPLESEAKNLVKLKIIDNDEIVKTSYDVDWNVENYNDGEAENRDPSPVWIYCYRKI
ncbi:methyltransferase-like protein 27 [Styela clava]